jgi:hypothetical protein
MRPRKQPVAAARDLGFSCALTAPALKQILYMAVLVGASLVLVGASMCWRSRRSCWQIRLLRPG